MMKKITFITIFCIFYLSSFAQWTQIDDYPGGATDGAPTFVIDNKAYVAGGVFSKKLYEFDMTTETWLEKAEIPGNVNRGWAFAFSINGKAYVGGGDNSTSFVLTDDFREYDPITDTWTQKSDFGGGNIDGAFACTVNGKGYVIGGFNGSYAVSTVYEYDPLEDTWTEKSSYPGGQAIFPSGFVYDDKIYVGLGSASGMAGSQIFYEYVPATDTWTQKADFPGASRQACYSFIYDGLAYIGGGEENYSSIYNDTYQYNPETNTWLIVDSLEFPDNSTAWCSSFVLGNSVYVGLGANFNGGSLNFSDNFFKISFASEIAVTEININGGNQITNQSGTLQMYAEVLPENASDNSVSWSISNGSEFGEISDEGLLTAIANGVLTVRATANDGSFIFGETDVEISNQNVGIEKINYGFSIFPNPTNGKLNFDFTNQNIKTIKVFDLIGNELIKKTKVINYETIDLSNLEKGIYLIEISNFKKIFTTKIIKN